MHIIYWNSLYRHGIARSSNAIPAREMVSNPLPEEDPLLTSRMEPVQSIFTCKM